MIWLVRCYVCIRYGIVCLLNMVVDSGVILYYMFFLIVYKNNVLLIVIYIFCINKLWVGVFVLLIFWICENFDKLDFFLFYVELLFFEFLF